MGSKSHISNYPPLYSLSEGLWSIKGWEPRGEQNGAALFEMFLTSFCAPVGGPASSVWLGPVFLLSLAPLPIWCPRCCFHSSSHIDQFQFSSMLLLLKPAQFLFSWPLFLFLFLFLFSFFLLSLVFVEDSEKNLSYGSLCWDWNWKRT